MAGGVLQDGGPVCVHGGDGRDTQGKLGSRGGSWRVRQRHMSDVHHKLGIRNCKDVGSSGSEATVLVNSLRLKGVLGAFHP